MCLRWNRRFPRIDHSEEVTAEWEDCASYNDDVIGRLKEAISKGKRGYRFTQRDLLGKEQ